MAFPLNAKIKSRQMIAEGTLMVEFDLQGQDVEFRPGQVFFIEILNPLYTDERGPKRHFSIVNSPNEKGILAFATKVRDSAFKKSIQELPLGTEVKISMIAGRAIPLDDQTKTYVFMAGGIGITPFRAAIKFINEQKLPLKITLLYSNKDQKSTAFFDEINAFAKENPNIKVVFTMTQDENWTGEKGRIDGEFIRKSVSDIDASTFFISGPGPMVDALKKAVTDLGVGEERIKVETFTGY